MALGDIGQRATSALPDLAEALRYTAEPGAENWNERARDAVADAIERMNDPTAKTRLTGQGARFAMWGLY